VYVFIALIGGRKLLVGSNDNEYFPGVKFRDTGSTLSDKLTSHLIRRCMAGASKALSSLWRRDFLAKEPS
jgi:hypothetical protein